MTIKLGQNPIIQFKDLEGNEATVKGDFIVEKALKVPMSKKKLKLRLES